MSALGEMAGGVAHEINNPLAVITMNLDLTKDILADEEIDLQKINKSISAIEKTTNRIAKIVSGLRLFSRDGTNDPVLKTNFISIIDETLAFCTERFKSRGIGLDYSVITKELFIECRPVQISQALLNLLNNSYDAVVHLQDKWIKVEVLDLGEVVKLIVSDSGKGIDEKIRNKIMQPFFTTKAIGSGIGLGLSISKGIVESHSGSISLNSNSSNTTFEILLPKRQATIKEEAAA